MGVVFWQNVSNSGDRGAFSSGVSLGVFPELLYRLQMFLLEDSLRQALVPSKTMMYFAPLYMPASFRRKAGLPIRGRAVSCTSTIARTKVNRRFIWVPKEF